MKYCSKCGNQMSDDMLFCQQCGTKAFVTDEDQKNKKETENKMPVYETETKTNSSSHIAITQANKLRTSMKVWMIICFILSGIYALVALAEPSMLAMTLFLGILGIMFLCLAKTPKGSLCIFGKEKGMKKTIFVLVCVAIAFVSFAIMMSLNPPAATNETTSSQNQDMETKAEIDEKTTLSDVKKWYENEMPAVSQNLIEYASSVKGISNINVTESKFRLGEDSGWYDCHYTFLFTCKINGENCFGEARAFRKYNDSDINWFHFEIARDSDWSTVVEQYDDSSDALIESYYKELVSQYK